MENIKKFLLDQGIPIWNHTQIKSFFGHKSYVDNVIAPGFFVCLKSYNSFLHSDSVIKILNRLDDIVNRFKNPEFILYLYVTHYEEESTDFEKIKSNLSIILKDLNNHEKIKIINSVRDIQINIPKYIASHETLKSFVSRHQELYPIFKDKNIYTSNKNWNRSIVIMYPEEEEILNRFKIDVLSDEELIKIFDQDLCCILQQSTSYSFDKENQFSYHIKTMHLGKTTRIAIRRIKDVSDICKRCGRLTFVKHIKGDACKTCLRIGP